MQLLTWLFDLLSLGIRYMIRDVEYGHAEYLLYKY